VSALAAFDLRGSGFRNHAELAAWLEFVAWDSDPDADPERYALQEGSGWAPVVRAAQVLPWIHALADLLVADLLRVSLQNA
jgi:hypothetical protein